MFILTTTINYLKDYDAINNNSWFGCMPVASGSSASGVTSLSSSNSANNWLQQNRYEMAIANCQSMTH